MYIAIQHTITDPEKWQIAVKSFPSKLTKDLKPHTYSPSTDGKRANCLWEADSVEAVKSFVEREFGHCSQNEYYEVDGQSAMGLPQ
ncbi:MAG TPA: hypothetical protein VIU33_00800 [Nitrospiria bacterium]